MRRGVRRDARRDAEYEAKLPPKRPARTRSARAGAVRVIVAVVGANLLRLARDRVSLVFIVAVPFLLILLIGVSQSSGASDGRPIGVVAPEGGGASGRLVEALRDEPTLATTRYADRAALAAAVRRGYERAGVVIVPDHDARLADGDRVEVLFLTDPASAPPLAVRTSVAQIVAAQSATARSAHFVAMRFGVPVAAVLEAAEALPTFGGTEVESVTHGSAGRTLPTGFDYTAPTYLVLFMFINTLVAAWGIPADRTLGLERRAFAAPTGATALLLGQWLYRLLVALLQAALIVVVGAVLFGVRWGDPLAVTAIVLLFGLVSTGASILLGSVARTGEQVTALAPPIGIALGMLGGCMWPLEVVGPTMRAIGHATPHAWAVSAFHQVVGAGAGVRDVAGELAVLAAFALVLLAAARVVFGRTVTRA